MNIPPCTCRASTLQHELAEGESDSRHQAQAPLQRRGACGDWRARCNHNAGRCRRGDCDAVAVDRDSAGSRRRDNRGCDGLRRVLASIASDGGDGKVGGDTRCDPGGRVAGAHLNDCVGREPLAGRASSRVGDAVGGCENLRRRGRASDRLRIGSAGEELRGCQLSETEETVSRSPR